MPIPCVCEVCSTVFNVPPSRIKAGKVRFCSRACNKAGNNGDKNSQWKGGLVKRNCLVCSAPFEVKPKEIKRGSGNYCSRPCSAKVKAAARTEKHKAKRVRKHCVVCAAEILVKPSHVAKEGTYCSRACQSIGYGARMMGTENPNFKNAGYENYSKSSPRRRLGVQAAKLIENHSGKEWLALVASYNNTCACCKQKGGKLTKDHIIPITKGGHHGISNLQPLCHRCNVKKFTKTIRYAHQLVFAI